MLSSLYLTNEYDKQISPVETYLYAASAGHTDLEGHFGHHRRGSDECTFTRVTTIGILYCIVTNFELTALALVIFSR